MICVSTSLVEHSRLSHGNDLHRLSSIVALNCEVYYDKRSSSSSSTHVSLMATIFIGCRASWLYSSTRDCSVISRRTFTLHQAISAPFFSVIRSTGLLPEYLLSILFPASYGRRALLPAHTCSSRAILTSSAVNISFTASLRDCFVNYRRIHQRLSFALRSCLCVCFRFKLP